jgi:hypothetical protein
MRYYLITAMIVMALIGSAGCQRAPAVDDTTVLMTVGTREIHQDEFQRAYRVFRSAYEEEAEEDPADQRAAIIRFIHQLADETMLMAYAQDAGVAISDKDLDRAVEAIRQDYPEGLFDQMLLETAVNFADWKAALRRRLTIERLIKQELTAKVTISEADIAAYYRDHAAERPLASSPEEEAAAAQADEMIVQQLRRQKTEEAYGPWIEHIRAQYPVTIDQAVVKHILDDYGVGMADSDPDAP